MKTRSLCLGSLYPTLNGGTFESEVRRRRVNQSSPTDGDHLNTTESYRGSGKCYVDKQCGSQGDRLTERNYIRQFFSSTSSGELFVKNE